MPRIPVVEDLEDRDPLLAVRTMGAGNVTVLPAPLIGTYTTHDLRVVDLNVVLPDDATPVLLQTLVHRLQDQYDMITWNVVPDDTVAEILLGLGFVNEAHWRPELQTHQSLMAWRRPPIVLAVG